jgi:hypothetical protein
MPKKPRSGAPTKRSPVKAPSASGRPVKPTAAQRAFAKSKGGRLALGLAPRTKS